MSLSPLFLLLLLLAPALPLHAQREYDRWYFGYDAGLSFSGSGAVAARDGTLKTDEGVATICDRTTGDLLFYTDGVTVWNRDHQVMAGGTRLAGHRSSAQSAVIVPVPCSATRYYIFTTDTEPLLDPPNNGMHYSLVDLERFGGRGEVVTKNVPMLAAASERMTAARHANGTDYWVITHSLGGNTFFAFQVTSSGLITTPVNSSVGLSQGDPVASEIWTMGMMKMSPDGRRLAQTVRNLDLLELFDFDPATGIISAPLRIPALGDYPWGVSFSPDNSRLYVAGDASRQLLQYTLLPNDPDAIAASRTVLADVGNGSDLQIGPDAHIYISALDDARLDLITRPNERGTASGYSQDVVDLSPGVARWALPNNIVGGLQSFDDCDLIARLEVSDAVLCGGGCTRVVDRSVGRPHSWTWSFPGGTPSSHVGETPPAICYQSPGRYPVTLVVQGEARRETAVGEVVVAPVPKIDAGPDLRLCSDSSTTIRTSVTSGEPARYSWSPAAGLSCVDCSSPVADPSVGTTYRVTMTTVEGCVAIDSVRVEVGRGRARIAIGRDHVGEPGDTLFLPVVLADPLDIEGVTAMTMLIRYDSTAMRILPGHIRTDSLLMQGWDIVVIEEGRGYLRIDCRAPSGNWLRGTGPTLALPAQLFLGSIDSSEIAIEVIPDRTLCTDLASTPGLLRITGCSVDTRLIELFDAKHALPPPGPSPFRESIEIRFSLALPGAARLTISDAAGREITVLVDGELSEGWQTVIWNASSFPAGRYYVSLAVGPGKETVMVVKID